MDFADISNFTFAGADPACPKCDKVGDLVPNTVFRSNLKSESRLILERQTNNFICRDVDCEIAYYNRENYVLAKDLKRDLWYKTFSTKTIACYCNNIDKEQVKEAYLKYNLTSWKQITSHYRKKIIENCEFINPTGICCRSEFRKIVDEIKKAEL